MGKEYDCHHCVPRSRNHKLAKVSWNRRYMKRSVHAAYHIICGNKTPIEALIHIFKLFVPREALALEPDKVDEIKRLLEGS